MHLGDFKFSFQKVQGEIGGGILFTNMSGHLKKIRKLEK